MMMTYIPPGAVNWTRAQLEDYLQAVSAFDTPARAFDRWVECFCLECDGTDWWRGDERPAGLWLDRMMDALCNAADGDVYDPSLVSTLYPV